MRPCNGYTVIKVLNVVVYRIQPTPRSKAKVVHRNRLWKYAGATPPSWFSTTQPSNASNEEEPNEESSAENA
jgi:hypothetical protein